MHYELFMNIRPYIIHCNENPIYVFPEKELRRLNPNFHIQSGNWDWGRAIHFLGIFVSNFRYCDFTVLLEYILQ